VREGITSQADNSWDTYAINFSGFFPLNALCLLLLLLLLLLRLCCCVRKAAHAAPVVSLVSCASADYREARGYAHVRWVVFWGSRRHITWAELARRCIGLDQVSLIEALL
jgi:hypothetical protein